MDKTDTRKTSKVNTKFEKEVWKNMVPFLFLKFGIHFVNSVSGGFEKLVENRNQKNPKEIERKSKKIEKEWDLGIQPSSQTHLKLKSTKPIQTRNQK